MGEDSAGEYRFRICKAKGCNNGTTMVGGVCSVCRRSGVAGAPHAATVGMNASPHPRMDKIPGGQR